MLSLSRSFGGNPNMGSSSKTTRLSPVHSLRMGRRRNLLPRIATMRPINRRIPLYHTTEDMLAPPGNLASVPLGVSMVPLATVVISFGVIADIVL